MLNKNFFKIRSKFLCWKILFFVGVVYIRTVVYIFWYRDGMEHPRLSLDGGPRGVWRLAGDFPQARSILTLIFVLCASDMANGAGPVKISWALIGCILCESRDGSECLPCLILLFSTMLVIISASSGILAKERGLLGTSSVPRMLHEVNGALWKSIRRHEWIFYTKKYDCHAN